MRYSLRFSLFAIVAIVFTSAEGQSLSSIDLSQLREARLSTRPPAQKVAFVDAWLQAHPQVDIARRAGLATFQERMARLSALITPPKPSTQMGGLIWDIRQVLAATLAQAHNPREAIALIDEFQRLNAASMNLFVPKFPTPSGRRANLLQTISQYPSIPGNLRSEIGASLLATRAEANNPAEMVALTDEFLRLNAQTLTEASVANQKTKSPR